MKVRVKFSKQGILKFVGHLDIMRFFQKAMRRAEIDIAFSNGFSPHMIMSFASPLSVGLTSDAEYFDLELNTPISTQKAIAQLNQVMAEGIQVLNFRQIPEDKKNNAMALIAAADYTVSFREMDWLPKDWKEKLKDFYRQEEILIVKKTKRTEKEVDIKPTIYALEEREGSIWMKLAAGSVENLKPDLVLEAFAAYVGCELPPFVLLINRDEMYGVKEEGDSKNFVSLEELGEDIEE